MCGHVGIAGEIGFKHEAVMKKLLLLDFWRGTDSTGLAAVRKSGDVSLSKIASHPLDLFDMTKFKTALSGYSSSAFIGHNRAATKGVVNNTNAHPYEFGDVVGAHNGTLTESSWKALEEAYGEKTGTDSAAIFACIDKIGIEETVKLLQGAWALVWYDRRDNTLNFLRNKERPFWYAYSEDLNTVYWASEHWMIQDATRETSTHKYPLYVDDKKFSFYPSAENWHYRFDLKELANGKEKPKPKCRELHGKEPEQVKVAVTTFPRQASGHGRKVTGGTTTTTTQTTSTKARTTPEVKTVTVPAALPLGDYITPAKIADMTRYGCHWCHEDIDPDDTGLIVFEQEEFVIGSCCSGRNKPKVYADPGHMQKYVSASQAA